MKYLCANHAGVYTEEEAAKAEIEIVSCFRCDTCQEEEDGENNTNLISPTK